MSNQHPNNPKGAEQQKEAAPSHPNDPRGTHAPTAAEQKASQQRANEQQRHDKDPGRNVRGQQSPGPSSPSHPGSVLGGLSEAERVKINENQRRADGSATGDHGIRQAQHPEDKPMVPLDTGVVTRAEIVHINDQIASLARRMAIVEAGSTAKAGHVPAKTKIHNPLPG